MADHSDSAVNAGDQVVNTTSSLPLKPEDQFRLINTRLDTLSDALTRVAKPPAFRMADAVELIAILITILVAVVGGFSLSERIADVRTDQAAMEHRLTDAQSATESRLSTKLDKLSDQFTAMDERTARLEGAKSSP